MAAILALDTSTEACSCALSIDGDLFEKHVIAPRQHASLILLQIEDLMQENHLSLAQLDALAWGRGPGSFTGLRIAAGVVQGLAFGANLPVISISTLAAIAYEAHRASGADRVLACLDARIDEVYWGVFHMGSDGPQLLGEEQLSKPEVMSAEHLAGARNCAAAGNGLCYEARFPQAVVSRVAARLPELLPRAGSIALLAADALVRGELQAPEDVRPVYLRDKVTQH